MEESIKHLLGINELSTTVIQDILDRALFFSQKPNQFFQELNQVVVAQLFFENSTRTKLSFEMATKKMGGQVLDFNPSSSSIKKGETFFDTLRTIEALGPQIAVIRHSDDNLLEELKDKTHISLINAGAGKKEHPTQALLDALTMLQEFGSLENKVVTICGDIKYSRVARSNMALLKKLGAHIQISAPDSLLIKEEGITNLPIDEAIKNSDVMMMLRIQTERHLTLEVNSENYLEKYGLTHQRAEKMKKGAIIMHPGPFNRGVEIDGSLPTHERSRIFKQVSNGVFTRMAVLEYINKERQK